MNYIFVSSETMSSDVITDKVNSGESPPTKRNSRATMDTYNRLSSKLNNVSKWSTLFDLSIYLHICYNN